MTPKIASRALSNRSGVTPTPRFIAARIRANCLTVSAASVTPIARPFPRSVLQESTTMDHSRNLSRRRFLQAGASAAAVFVTAPAWLRAADDPFGGFTLGVQSYTFRDFDTEPALKRIQELGLHYVEFFQKHAPPNSSPEAIKALLRLCGD